MTKTKWQKDKQRCTKHAHKIKDRVTRTLLRIVGERSCSGRVNSSCSNSGTRRINLVTNPVISNEWGNTGKCLRQVEHISDILWYWYSKMVNQVMGATVKLSKWWIQYENWYLLLLREAHSIKGKERRLVGT